MEKLETLLARHNVEWQVVNFLKYYVKDYYNISTDDFINTYTVREILGWRKVGQKTVMKLADIFDKEGLSLRY
jgi:hypothetical protein